MSYMFTFMHEIDIPKNPAHRRGWIKYQLGLRGLNFAAVGSRLGVTRNTVYVVFRWPYPKVERAIAGALGMKPEQIWPERYDAQGRTNRPMGRQKQSSHARKEIKDTTSASRGNGKNRRAA